MEVSGQFRSPTVLLPPKKQSAPNPLKATLCTTFRGERFYGNVILINNLTAFIEVYTELRRREHNLRNTTGEGCTNTGRPVARVR